MPLLDLYGKWVSAAVWGFGYVDKFEYNNVMLIILNREKQK
jgi:hypothetical protein